jgi:hypothetical protein
MGALPLACEAAYETGAVNTGDDSMVVDAGADAGSDDSIVVDAGADAGSDDSIVVDAGADAGSDAHLCLCPSEERDIRWEDLSCLCAWNSCPQLSALIEPIESCSAQPSSFARGPYLHRGCGRIEYEMGYHGNSQYQFDASTKNLIAARVSTDLSFGPCTAAYAHRYTAGPFVELADCPDFSECLNCKTLLPAPGAIPACEHP